MPDWTERLTEEEREAVGYTETVGENAKYRDRALNAVEVRHVCHEALAAFRTVALLRALVAEKDKALAVEHGPESSVTEYSFKVHNRCYCEEVPQSHGCHQCAALALKAYKWRDPVEESL